MINFFSENDFQLKEAPRYKQWIEENIALHSAEITEINYIFCDDDYLLQINKTYLQHDDYTDIITFDHSIGRKLEADIYISAERIADNATTYDVSFEEELRRVMIHGILHSIGFMDKTPQEKLQMRQEEDKALANFHAL